MPLKLVYNGLEFSLESNRLRVGRAEHCDVSIHGDPLISSHHCVIDHGSLTDQQSTNGTTVNGVKIKHQTPTPLKPGDVITLGETPLYIVEGRPYDGQQPTVNGHPLPPPPAGDVNSTTAAGKGKNPVIHPKSKGSVGSMRVLMKGSRAQQQQPAASDPYPVASAQQPPASSAYARAPPTVPASPTAAAPSTTGTLVRPPSAGSSSRPSIPPPPPPPPPAELDSSRLLDSSLNISVDDSLNASHSLLDVSRPFRRPSDADALDDSSVSSILPLEPAAVSSPSPDDSVDLLLAPSQVASSLDQTRIQDPSPFDSPHTQLRKLQAALRESEVKYGRLERKLAHSQRKSSVLPDLRSQAAKVTELEYANQALVYQMLYGDSSKDQELLRLKEELDRAKREAAAGARAAGAMSPAGGDPGSGLGEGRKEGVGVKEEAGTNGGQGEWGALALTPLNDAVSLLTSTRAELLTAWEACASQASTLLALQQSVAQHHASLADALMAQQREGHTDVPQLQLLADAIARVEKKIDARESELVADWRKDVAGLSARLSDIHRDVSDAAGALTIMQQKTDTAAATAAAAAAPAGSGEKRQDAHEESKVREASTASSSSKAPVVTGVNASPAISPSVTGQLKAIHVGVQQVWTMVAALLALSFALLAFRRS